MSSSINPSVTPDRYLKDIQHKFHRWGGLLEGKINKCNSNVSKLKKSGHWDKPELLRFGYLVEKTMVFFEKSKSEISCIETEIKQAVREIQINRLQKLLVLCGGMHNEYLLIWEKIELILDNNIANNTLEDIHSDNDEMLVDLLHLAGVIKDMQLLIKDGKIASTGDSACIMKDDKLTKKQLSEYKENGYLCQDKIVITGKIQGRKRNQLMVNGQATIIGDALLLLFIRLVIELKKKKGGWVLTTKLEKERIIPGYEYYQVFNRLRNDFKGNLLGKDGIKFIEANGLKRYRISTHPDFITYSKQKIRNHPDPQIKRLTARLP